MGGKVEQGKGEERRRKEEEWHDSSYWLPSFLSFFSSSSFSPSSSVFPRTSPHKPPFAPPQTIVKCLARVRPPRARPMRPRPRRLLPMLLLLLPLRSLRTESVRAPPPLVATAPRPGTAPPRAVARVRALAPPVGTLLVFNHAAFLPVFDSRSTSRLFDRRWVFENPVPLCGGVSTRWCFHSMARFYSFASLFSITTLLLCLHSRSRSRSPDREVRQVS